MIRPSRILRPLALKLVVKQSNQILIFLPKNMREEHFFVKQTTLLRI